MKEPRQIRYRLFLLLCTWVLIQAVEAQDISLEPVSQTYAIKNATIVQAPGRVIERGTVVVVDGVIKAVGKSVSIPANAQIIEADSMFVPNSLMAVNVPVIPYECCSYPYYKYPATSLDKTMFCAGGWNGEKQAGDACQGDSGGPIFVEVACDDDGQETCPVQIGIVSWGNGCGWIAVGYPGVYGRMSMFKKKILEFTGLPEATFALPESVVKQYSNSDYNFNRKCPESMQGKIEVRQVVHTC